MVVGFRDGELGGYAVGGGSQVPQGREWFSRERISAGDGMKRCRGLSDWALLLDGFFEVP